jgi:glucose-6-phosphate dehydrogenase assembly protein OpcA
VEATVTDPSGTPLVPLTPAASGAMSPPPLAFSTPRAARLDAVDHDLRALWDDAARAGSRVTRVQTMSLVALCETEAHALRAEPALAAAASAHGTRTLLATWGPPTNGEAEIVAQVSLHPSLAGAGLPVGEAVRLHAKGAAREFLPSAIGKLLAPDLPVAVWWVGDLPDHDLLFDRVARDADTCIFDSGEMDLRDLPRLAALAAREGRRYALADFSWLRLASWQELVARFFDPPECLPVLSSLERIVVRFQPRRIDPEPVSNPAALFVGWLAARLGWSLARWESVGEGAVEAQLKSATAVGPRVRFEPLARGAVRPGNLQDVRLEAGSACFHVERSEDDPSVLCWSSAGARYEVAAQCVRLEESLLRDEAKTLPRLLERPVRDPNLEQSLAAGAALIASIAPKAPGASGS